MSDRTKIEWTDAIPEFADDHADEADWDIFAHEHRLSCDRSENEGYSPRVGDVVRRCYGTALWWVDEVVRDGFARLMPYKNGMPGWWWRTTHVNVHACHLMPVVAAVQEALF